MAQRHFYLRDYSQKNKRPVGCIAVEVDRAANEIRYALASCSPLDQFSSEVARDKSSGRLKSLPVVLKGEVPKTGHEITASIMRNIIIQNQAQRAKLDPKSLEYKDWRNHRHYLALEAAQGWLEFVKTKQV